MTISAATMPTPTGPLTLLVEGGRLVAAGFTGRPEDLQARLGPALREVGLRRLGDLGEFSAALRAYLDGDVTAPDALPVDGAGTDHQQRVWKVLRDVPAGTTVSYRTLAARAGNPAAVRAAGTACARNLNAPVIPCHRVVRSDGGLGGYAYGLECKRWLLDHERRHAGR
jgi:methylated-DNA-[protein]-cysteine S-methyltransferase